MKSIVFTHFKDKLLEGSKQRTFRVLFIPTYEMGEIVKIDFKKKGKRETLFHARIIDIYPKQIKDIGILEAELDGFKSVLDFQKGIMKINKIKSLNRWGFFTRFERLKGVDEFNEVSD